MTIAVASGKGGTGKTLIATNLAAAAAMAVRSVALVDCDAEAPNDHLFFEGEVGAGTPVQVRSAVVDADACTACGKCRDVCAYGAIRILGDSAMVFDELCHGCGLCRMVCPSRAIHEEKRTVGSVETLRVESVAQEAVSGALHVITGTLEVGDVKTPQVIQAARKHAEELDVDTVILDAPPGVACAAVAAVRGADALLLVSEPTPFGLHDLELSARLGKDLGIPVALIVNRADTGTEDIDEWARSNDIPVLLHIPFSREIAALYADGKLVAAEDDRFASQIGCVDASVRAFVRSERLAPCEQAAVDGGGAQ